VTGSAWSPHDLLPIALWGVAGLLVATRRFRAESATPDAGPGRHPLRRLGAGR
jgi:hypothetical protein